MRPAHSVVTVLALVPALAAGAAGCGGDSGQEGGDVGPPNVRTTAMPDYAGAVATPPKPAPPLALEEADGDRFDMSKLRGKAVLVTFLYSNCPDIGPRIVESLRAARAKLGTRADEVEIVAVSTAPERDTAAAVKEFLKQRGMFRRMHYLVGSSEELSRAWRNWGITVRPSDSKTERIEHSAPVYGVSASGNITTLYATNFEPDQIVSDVPILARH